MKAALLILVASCMGLFASQYAEAGQWSGAGYITELYINATGDFVRIRFSQPIVNPDNCEGAEFYIRELEDSRGATRFLAVVSSAFFEQKRVSFWIDGCSQHKWWGTTRPRLFDIYIYE